MLAQFLQWYHGLTDSLLGAILIFILGAFLLIKGGDWFVDSAVGIAKKFRVPELLIGATVVSIGTTLPEVMVSVAAATNGNGAIAYGNGIGSIICNTALIAALTVAIRPARIQRSSIIQPVIFFFVALAVYMVGAYVLGSFNRGLGIALLVIFGIYLATSIAKTRKSPKDVTEQDTEAPISLWKNILVLIFSAALIATGADMLEGSSVSLATMARIPAEVVAVTVVALCTSLPELVTAVTALVKGHSALSLGNIIGANIFNLVLVTGAAATISPFPIPEGSQIAGIPTSLLVEIPLVLVTMGILTLPCLPKGKLRRWQGILLLAIYAAFIVMQVCIALR